MTAYATPDDMIERYDARPVGDLVADDGQQVTEEDLVTNTKLLTALEDASGEVESALIVGGRYSVSKLSGLTGNSAALLKRFVCELAKVNLLDRRMNLTTEQVDVLVKLHKLTDDRLKLLRTGENVFNLPEQIKASVISADGPTTLAVENLNLVRDRVGPAYYPARRMPFGR